MEGEEMKGPEYFEHILEGYMGKKVVEEIRASGYRVKEAFFHHTKPGKPTNIKLTLEREDVSSRGSEVSQ